MAIVVDLIDGETCLDVFIRVFDCAKNYPSKTQEIMILSTKTNWLRLFWNPVTRHWDVNFHSQSGWSAHEKLMSRAEILNVLNDWKDYLEKARGLQYKTVDQTHIFRKSALSVRHLKSEVKIHKPAKATSE